VAAVLAMAAASPLALPSTPAGAADMPAKAPAAKTYNWSGCYVGLNGGGAQSGSNFTTTVGPGTHLTPADAALVVEAGTSSANSPNFVGGGQAGCNWVSERSSMASKAMSTTSAAIRKSSMGRRL
jgi:outer membrane immunogenic protein